jgi:hypothetical protein
LSSAVRIQNTLPNVDVTLIADIFSPNTTSDGSAGFWEPHLVNPDQAEDIRFAKLEKTNDYENFEKGMIYMKILKKGGGGNEIHAPCACGSTIC